MRMYIIRHAESEANVAHVFAGQMDYPLSDKGKQDAILIAQWFTSRFTLKSIYCSPLLRARQTAQPFRISRSIPFVEDQRLAEQNLGIFQGTTYEDAKKNPLYIKDSMQRWEWQVPSGESYKDMAIRIESFFSTLDPNQADCLIVTHGAAMRIMRGVLENTLPIYPERIPSNGEIWEIDFKGIGKSHEIKSLFADNLEYGHHNV